MGYVLILFPFGAPHVMFTVGSSAESAAFEGILWLGGIVFAILAAVLIVRYWLRRVYNPWQDNRPSFTLQELRCLRDQGEISEVEYETLKQRVVESAARGQEG